MLLKVSRKAQIPFFGLWFVAFLAYLVLQPRPSPTLLFLFFLAFFVVLTATRAYLQRLLPPEAKAILKDRLHTPRPCDICGLYLLPQEARLHVGEFHPEMGQHQRRVRNAYFAILGGGLALMLVVAIVAVTNALPRPTSQTLALVSLIIFFAALIAPLVYFVVVESRIRARARQVWQAGHSESSVVR